MRARDVLYRAVATTTPETTVEEVARPHVRLSTGRPVSQYAGNEGCAGLAGAEPHASETGHGGLYYLHWS
jgi:hypothetical protein